MSVPNPSTSIPSGRIGCSGGLEVRWPCKSAPARSMVETSPIQGGKDARYGNGGTVKWARGPPGGGPGPGRLSDYERVDPERVRRQGRQAGENRRSQHINLDIGGGTRRSVRRRQRAARRRGGRRRHRSVVGRRSGR